MLMFLWEIVIVWVLFFYIKNVGIIGWVYGFFVFVFFGVCNIFCLSILIMWMIYGFV